MAKKKEADGLHPPSHYLVVENPDMPSTFHLRVRNMAGELDHRLMGDAWAALHDNFRGSPYKGPNKEEAIKKLEAMYEAEGMTEPGEDTEDTEDDGDGGHMKKAASAIASFKSEWVWAGVSHNAYIDRGRDILPLALLQKDLDRQTKWIAEGRFKDYGPLLLNHDLDMEIGRTLFKAIVPGTRMVLEAGIVQPEIGKKLEGRTLPMSLGYWYTADAKGYTEFVQYERSALVKKEPMNLLTRFKVYQREAATPDALATFSGENYERQ